MPKRQDDTDDDDIFDDRGLLKDKHSARVPMMMRDGLTDLQRSVRDHYAPARVVDAFGDSGAGLHRPGSRYLVAGAGTADHAVLVMRDHLRREARDQYIAELTSAWQRKPTQDLGGGVREAQPGDVCTVRGPEYPLDQSAPGHLDARLVCVPDKPRRDSMSRTMDAADAQRIRDEAYAEFVRLHENAWRDPRDEQSTHAHARAAHRLCIERSRHYVVGS
jgi:hypothetical protein